MDKISEIIADELGVKKSQVDSTIKLIDDGNTIPLLRDTERKQQEVFRTSS